MNNIQQDTDTYIMGTYGRFPISIAKGEGCYLYDEQGNSYLDFCAGIATNVLGYGYPKLTQALKTQLDTLIHVSNLYYTEPQTKVAKLLVDQSGLDKVFFCNSGTEANEAAIKIARKWGKKQSPSKIKILTMIDSFHGRTFGGLSATGQPKYQDTFAPMLEGFEYIQFNDVEVLENSMSEDICAVMLEVIQGESGIKSVSQSYMDALQRVCRQYNALLIIDEVQTGMGRCGTLFAHQYYGIKPDVMTLAKGLGGGIPIGAVVCGARADVLEKGDHGSTFGGNPLATTAAHTVIKALVEDGILENVKQVGDYFESELFKLQSKYSQIVDVRGRGLMRAIEIHGPARKLMEACIGNGLLVVGSGEYTVRFLPPLNISKSHIDEAIQKLECALKMTYSK